MKRKPKISSADYTPSMLPQTRKALYLDILRLHWQKLLLLGILLLAFALPMLLSGVLRDLYVSNLAGSVGDDMRAEAANALAYWEIGRSIVGIVLLMLFSVGLSGVLRVLRQYAWLENVHIPTDFARGIRDNSRQMLALAFLSGGICTLCRIVVYFSASYRSEILGAASLLPAAVSLLLFAPVFLIAMVMIPIYSNPLSAQIKNALHIYAHAPLKVLAALLCCASAWLPSLLPNFYCHLFGTAAALLLMPFILLAWTLFCYNRFDEQINPTCCPALIGKGIRHES